MIFHPLGHYRVPRVALLPGTLRARSAWLLRNSRARWEARFYRPLAVTLQATLANDLIKERARRRSGGRRR